MNFSRARPLLILMLVMELFSVSSDVSAIKTVDISERMKFFPPRLDQRYEKLQVFLKAADSITYSIAPLKPSEKALPCSVVISQYDLKDGYEIGVAGDVLRIMISEDSVAIERKPDMQSAILSSLLLNRFGIKTDKAYLKLPEWMDAGIQYRIERRRSPLFLQGFATYPGVRALCISGSEPDLWNIVSCPLGSGDGPSYWLYAETCSLLLDSIMKFPGGGRDILAAILKSDLKGEKRDDALRAALSESLTKSGMDQLPFQQEGTPAARAGDWFKMAARNGSVSIFFPGTSDFAVHRLEAFETVGYTVNEADQKLPSKKKDGDDKDRTCRISELGKKWGEIKNPEKIVFRCQRNFSDLSNQLPSMFQDEMNGFIVAFKRLKDGGREGFEDAYAKQRKSFVDEAARLGKLEKFIHDGERKFVPFAARYSCELKYLDETGSFARNFWPALDAELDKDKL